MNIIHLKETLQAALKEDLGFGDLSSELIFESGHKSRGQFKAKAEGVLCGTDLIEQFYSLLDAEAEVVLHKKDGDELKAGDIIADVYGETALMLQAERNILNLMQHLSGIATATADSVKRLDDHNIRICDTRKTLPGLRMLQKYAVRCGGGFNHRFRLDDGVMIKDNHIKAVGGITQAVNKIRASLGHMIKIEVETESKEQVLECANLGVDVIMMDNRSPEQVKEWTQLVPDGIITEVSGGIKPDNIAAYKGCGADYISIGWLTHSVKALDISFNLIDS
jgi:nicotinate-nucleotide pyrophosphorylase (carboxylating)